MQRSARLPGTRAATACRADASHFVIGGQQWPSDPTQARQAPPAPRLALAAALRYPSTPMKLYRAFATVGGLTLVSRVFGFLRDILIAATLGSGAVADAFVVAFKLPNFFRRSPQSPEIRASLFCEVRYWISRHVAFGNGRAGGSAD